MQPRQWRRRRRRKVGACWWQERSRSFARSSMSSSTPIHRRLKPRISSPPTAHPLTGAADGGMGSSSRTLGVANRIWLVVIVLGPVHVHRVLFILRCPFILSILRLLRFPGCPALLPLPRTLLLFPDAFCEDLVDFDPGPRGVLACTNARLGELVELLLDHTLAVLCVRVRIGNEARGVVQLQGEEVAVHVRLERRRANEVVQTEAANAISARTHGSINANTHVASSLRSTNLKSSYAVRVVWSSISSVRFSRKLHQRGAGPSWGM